MTTYLLPQTSILPTIRNENIKDSLVIGLEIKDLVTNYNKVLIAYAIGFCAGAYWSGSY